MPSRRHYWFSFPTLRAAEHFLANVRREDANAQLELRRGGRGWWWGRLSTMRPLTSGAFTFPGLVVRREVRWGRPFRLPSERRKP